MDGIGFEQDRKLDVIAIGRIGIDFFPNEYNCPLEETKTFTKSVGGSPANIAVATSRYGMKTGFIGRVADDAFGRFAIKYLQEKNINTEGLIVDQCDNKMGLAYVEIVSPKESNIIMYRADAVDLKLTMEDISEDYIKNSKVLVVSGTALAASPSREAVFLAMKLARKHNTKVFFDIDYRPYTWKSEEETGLYYSLAAEKCDVIIGTREEFDMLEKIDLPDNKEDKVSANHWFSYNAKIVIVKHGKDGSIAYLKNGEEKQGEVFPVKPLKTQGAGDSYAGGVISSLIKGKSITEAMKYGAGAAAIVVTNNSCSDAMPTEEEITDFIKNYVKEH
ncbi:5-dehydro-2-deoxygluconokinase [Vallitalea guaymasensis]|uniref:5-dehydro-2-deoxygluconokinase n=1 Tax=Vallitalea guaymasensis TaxID=1185412 RepID=UPI00272CAB06|nr:5-dehydro-2-deoxygluconokinase [Vallitalea guaymasensis]